MIAKSKRGYSIDLVELVEGMDPSRIGVRLARACIAHRIPVQTIAERLSVSRYTVYNWFQGVHEPRGRVHNAIVDILKELEAQ